MSLSTDLACAYSMEEATGLTRVDSWAGYNLTQHGGVSQVPGKLNFGAGFASASSQYLSHTSVPEVFSMNFYKGGFTVAFWVYVTSLLVPISPMMSVAGEWSIALDTGGAVVFTVYGDVFGASGTATSATNVVINTWCLVVCEFRFVINGSATFLSMNNTLSCAVNNGTAGTGTMTANSSTATGSGAFEIGRDTFTYPAVFFNGNIDQVSIWQRIITTAEQSLLAGVFYPYTPAVYLPRSWSWSG